MLGIIVEENFTISEQDDPKGNVVHVLAQKYAWMAAFGREAAFPLADPSKVAGPDG
jgi:hypothetical protein